jgi:chromosome segregation ATPase
LHNTHQTAAALLHALGLTAGGGLTLAALWKIGQSAGGALAKLAGWLKSRRERQFTESVGHEHNTIEQRRVDMEAKNAEEDRLLKLAEHVQRQTMDLVDSLQRQIDTQSVSIKNQSDQIAQITIRMAQVEEAARFSDLTAQAAHIRADKAEKEYATAQVKIDLLTAENASLSAQIRDAAAKDLLSSERIAVLTTQVEGNLREIETLKQALKTHRQAAHKAAEITLHDTQE